MLDLVDGIRISLLSWISRLLYFALLSTTSTLDRLGIHWLMGGEIYAGKKPGLLQETSRRISRRRIRKKKIQMTYASFFPS